MNAMEHGNEYRADRPGRDPRAPLGATACACRSPTRAAPARSPTRGDARPRGEARGLQKPRGWGLFLIENMVDETRVTSDEGNHTVELVLRLEGGDDGDD